MAAQYYSSSSVVNLPNRDFGKAIFVTHHAHMCVLFINHLKNKSLFRDRFKRY